MLDSQLAKQNSKSDQLFKSHDHLLFGFSFLVTALQLLIVDGQLSRDNLIIIYLAFQNVQNPTSAAGQNLSLLVVLKL